jgi:PAS domain S-box-containing protein
MSFTPSDLERWKKISTELGRAAMESLEITKKIQGESAAISQEMRELAFNGGMPPVWFAARFGDVIQTYYKTYIRFLADLDRIHAQYVELHARLRADRDAPDPEQKLASPDPSFDLPPSSPPHIVHVLDRMPAMVGYWDRDLRNRFANRDYSSWFGLTPKDILGKHIREVIGEERFKLNLPYIQGALGGRPQHFERTITDPSGRVRTALAHYVPDVDQGRVVGFYAFVADAVTPSAT